MCSDTYDHFFSNFLDYLTELVNDSCEEEDSFVRVTEENVAQHFPKSYSYQDLMKAPLIHHYMDKDARMDLWEISSTKPTATKRNGCKLFAYFLLKIEVA